MSSLDVAFGFALGFWVATIGWICVIGLIKQRLGIGGKR